MGRLRVVAVGVVTATVVVGLAVPAVARPEVDASSSPTLTIPPGPPAKYLLHPGASAPPKIAASGWLIADANTGKVLASRAADSKRAPASTLKVLTALALLPRLDANSWYRATRPDEATEGSHAGLVAGARYQVKDLCHGLLLPSGNDTAMALARAYGGIGPAVRLMNAEARRVGATNTYAVNPSGLDAPGQVSTPTDLATLFRAALANKLFRHTVHLKSATFPDGRSQRRAARRGGRAGTYEIWTQDRLLMAGYPGLIGGKSGYTSNAGRTFVGAGTRDGHTLIYSLMGVESSTEDAARQLLDWGFANHDQVSAVATLPAAQPADGRITPKPAASYSVDGRLLSTRAQTAVSAEQPKGSTDRVAQQTVTFEFTGSNLPWVAILILVFIGAAAIMVSIGAIARNRPK